MTEQMAKSRRWVWLLRRLMQPEQNERVDVLDAKLAADFLKATGAPSVRTLKDDLRGMYERGLVERARYGVTGRGEGPKGTGKGLARSVYAYTLGLKAGAYIVEHGGTHE